MNKEHEQQLKIILDSLDRIYNNSVEITKAYNSEYIPLNTLWELTQRSKQKKNKNQKAHVKGYNGMIDKLYKVSMNYCEQYDLNKRLPMVVLKKYISVLKESYEASFRSSNK